MSKGRWHFSPYHQRIEEAVEKTRTPPPADTEWEPYEVFVQERRGQPHEHVGAVHAPDPEMALVLAKEQFGRRGRVVQIWVAPQRCIAETPIEDQDVFQPTTDKSYREAYGYRTSELLRAIREGQS